MRSGRAGGAYRVARRLWFQASLFSHGVGPFLPCVPGLSALKGYKCGPGVYHKLGKRLCLKWFQLQSFLLFAY